MKNEITTVQLSHGGGGVEMNELLNGLFYKHFANDILLKAEDAAVFEIAGKIAYTTDSFTVSPIEFSGGNIGSLAIAGTLNDLSVMGAEPLYLSAGFMIEEGLAFETLERIVKTMADELAQSNAKIVCGDTKVVPKGAVDQIFINTSGVGQVRVDGISAHAIREGDAIIVSNNIGQHGATIFAHREGISMSGNLSSDCAVLEPAIKELLASGVEIHAMRDATRGGLAAVLNEWAVASEVCIEIDERDIPVSDEVRGVCELFGFEPYDFANEGTFVLALPASETDKALATLKANGITAHSAKIGNVTMRKPSKVVLNTPWGSARYLELPKGELLPRIC
jgi:hydrogenase expression/formation protein HypE